MAKKRRVAPSQLVIPTLPASFGRGEGEFDPGAGQARFLSPQEYRSPAVLRALMRDAGTTTAGLRERPLLSDELAVRLQGGGGSGWGGPLFHRVPWKLVGRGANRRWRYVWMPSVGLGVAVLGAYALDRVGIAVYNALDNAYAKAFGAVGAKANPLPALAFPAWLAPHFNVNSWVGAFQSLAGGAPGGSGGGGGGSAPLGPNTKCDAQSTLMYLDQLGQNRIYACIPTWFVGAFQSKGWAVAPSS